MESHRRSLEDEIIVAKELLNYEEMTYVNVKFLIALLHELDNSKDGMVSSDDIAAAYKCAVAVISSRKKKIR